MQYQSMKHMNMLSNYVFSFSRRLFVVDRIPTKIAKHLILFFMLFSGSLLARPAPQASSTAKNANSNVKKKNKKNKKNKSSKKKTKKKFLGFHVPKDSPQWVDQDTEAAKFEGTVSTQNQEVGLEGPIPPTHKRASTRTKVIKDRSGELVWYEPSNLGNAGGYSQDFGDLFTVGPNSPWSASKELTDVLMLRVSTLRAYENANPGFIASRLVPFFNANRVKLALDSTAATWLSCKSRTDQNSTLNDELVFIRSLIAAGLKIDFISLQSTLSKNPTEEMKCEYPLNKRIRDIARYLKTIQSNIPQLASTQFGLIDASLAKGDAWVARNLGVANVQKLYDQLFRSLKKNRLKLSYLHLDHPWDSISEFRKSEPSSFADIAALQEYLTKQKVKAGIILTSTYSNSDKQFNTRIQQVVRTFVRKGAVGRHFVLASWKAFPRSELPENPQEPASKPLTSILLEAASFLKRSY